MQGLGFVRNRGGGQWAELPGNERNRSWEGREQLEAVDSQWSALQHISSCQHLPEGS